jgi:competence protein ComEA
MDLLSRVQSTIGFTRNEAKVALFLGTTFLLGLGVRVARDGAASPPPRFDYRAADSVFTARAAALGDTASPRAVTSTVAPRKAAAPAPASIRLNDADAETLTRLPGIGPAFAERIVSYRKEHGPFRSVEDLLRVKGIGPKKLERIKPFLTLQH